MIYEHACRLGLEGIVSKHIDLHYKPGPSKSWIKVKIWPGKCWGVPPETLSYYRPLRLPLSNGRPVRRHPQPYGPLKKPRRCSGPRTGPFDSLGNIRLAADYRERRRLDAQQCAKQDDLMASTSST